MKNNLLDDIKEKSYTDKTRKFDFTVSLWVYYVTRPISFLFTRLLIPTQVNPNTVTLLSLFFAIVSLFYFSNGGYLSFIIGAFFYNIFLIFDSVDGNIARYQNKMSSRGELLDAFVGDIANTLIIPALLIGLIKSEKYIIVEAVIFNNPIYLFLILLSSILYLISVLFFQRKKNLLDLTTDKVPNQLFDNPSKIIKFTLIFMRNLFGFAFMAPALIFCSIFNLMIYLLIYVVLTNYLIFLFTFAYCLYLTIIKK